MNGFVILFFMMIFMNLGPKSLFDYVKYIHCSFVSFGYAFFLFVFCSLDQGKQVDMKQEPPPRMSIRRNLCVSLPPQSPKTVAKAQAFEEGMYPLQCTPEPAQKTAQVLPLGSSSPMDPNMTFEVQDNVDQSANNATIIISRDSPCKASRSTDVIRSNQPFPSPKASGGNKIIKR